MLLFKRLNIFLLHIKRNVNAELQDLKHSFSLKTAKENLNTN